MRKLSSYPSPSWAQFIWVLEYENDPIRFQINEAVSR